jgi:hypothetical protein
VDRVAVREAPRHDVNKKQVQVFIYSVSGKTVFSGTVPVYFGQAVINTAAYPDGLYNIGLKDGEDQTLLKGIKR